jgi:hypothetical protein
MGRDAHPRATTGGDPSSGGLMQTRLGDVAWRGRRPRTLDSYARRLNGLADQVRDRPQRKPHTEKPRNTGAFRRRRIRDSNPCYRRERAAS